MADTKQTTGAGAPKTNGSAKTPVVDVSVATSANNLSAVPDIVKSISALDTAAVAGDETARLELVEKARKLVRSLETPRETMIKHCWAQVSCSDTVRSSEATL